jgi:hypothetical protein
MNKASLSHLLPSARKQAALGDDERVKGLLREQFAELCGRTSSDQPLPCKMQAAWPLAAALAELTGTTSGPVDIASANSGHQQVPGRSHRRGCVSSPTSPRRDSARPLHGETTLMAVPIIPSPALPHLSMQFSFSLRSDPDSDQKPQLVEGASA